MDSRPLFRSRTVLKVKSVSVMGALTKTSTRSIKKTVCAAKHEVMAAIERELGDTDLFTGD